MPRTCTVCRHLDRASIDAALVAATTPFRPLAAQFGLSPSALRRHRSEHLPAALVKAGADVNLTEARSLFAYVRALQARSAAILEKAEATGDLRIALGALRELRGIADLVMRAADRDAARVPVAIVKAYVDQVVQVFGEFVPADRIEAALARLQQLTDSAMDAHLDPHEDAG